MYPHFDLINRIGEVDKTENILVLGCGRYESDIARQILEIPCNTLMSVDSYEPHIQYIETLNPKAVEHFYALEDIKNIGETPFPAKPDIILLIDVVEHLTKEDAEKLLDKIETWGARKIVIFIPLEPKGFFRTNPHPENQSETHLSQWEQFEFKRRGYETERIVNCHSEKMPDGEYKSWDALWAIKNI